ncbi:unnamed protein product [Euphydryas editha]|uniref:Uncharacterized protein n=1 Tax=Euphydryas editha TaxID=104508 RepID=A0AAU9USY9_EUPED|nr:unnamed protein product [Euphydryas editha]
MLISLPLKLGIDADIWSGKKTKLLGCDVSLDKLGSPNSFRYLYYPIPIACRRFAGTHSYDRIALLLESNHTEFDLDCQKVLTTVTDSVSNIVKAFKEFGLEEESCNFADVESESEGGKSISVVRQESSTSSSTN